MCRLATEGVFSGFLIQDDDICVTELPRRFFTSSESTEPAVMFQILVFCFQFMHFWHKQNSPCSFPLHAVIPFSMAPSPSELGLSEDSFWEGKKDYVISQRSHQPSDASKVISKLKENVGQIHNNPG